MADSKLQLILLAALLGLGCSKSEREKSGTPIPSPELNAPSAGAASLPPSTGGAPGVPSSSVESALTVVDPVLFDRCTLKCQATAKELKCTHGDKCAESCAKLRNAAFCKSQVARFVTCFLEQPTPDWNCDDKGIPTLGHVCEPEQNGVEDCIRKNGSL